MAENSGIQWTDHTFNMWRGCRKVSEGCRFCYASDRADRFSEDFAGNRTMLSERGQKEPFRWNREAVQKYPITPASDDGIKLGESLELVVQKDMTIACVREGTEEVVGFMEDDPKAAIQRAYKGAAFPVFEIVRVSDISGWAEIRRKDRPRVFSASLSDVFEDWKGPIKDHNGNVLDITMDDLRTQLFLLIDSTPNLDWLLLTKRPENISRMWNAIDSRPTGSLQKYRPNVWLGTSVEDQEQAERRISELLKCRDLSPVLFLSCEPLLGPVDLSFIDCGGVMNCLSGTHEEEVYFADQLTANCVNGPAIDWVIAGGESGTNARPCDLAWLRSLRDQCKDAGVAYFLKQLGASILGASIDKGNRHPKGGDITEWPEDMQIREFPNVVS